ncbi:non-ribosomal peptide synthetase [Streptacidiphilus sp. P02-A3a]|uniref:non-ribosomal peptide synthetase n=1 Tax=Streptacidiphilus sp. P02-A3a TaxID=2704468 RepID=UPI0015FAE8EB|nr:non-ribosomal peptide synthetase [Streptacidiphilus sp. P02-A3a]QMU67387.1 non-ribosomal peptide synthetase [Streptacidiphilus sp. P02-A3a]
MFTRPQRPAVPGPTADRRRAWQLDGWTALRLGAPGLPAGRHLSAALALLSERYALPLQVDAAPGCGSPRAAQRYLAAAGAAADWPELVAATGADEPGPAVPAPGAPVPVCVRVAAEPGPSTGADLVWAATEQGLEASWDPSVFPEETVLAMAGHLERLAEQLVRPDPPPLSELSVLTPGELALNGGTPDRLPQYPPITLHQLFQLQAWRTPHGCALAMGEDRLSYRELDEASNLAAHRLIAAGTSAGDVVAVGGERCLGLFVSLLAVLKAGCVFVHLDPAYPVPRLRQFVEVSSPRLVMSGPGARELGTGLPELAFPAVPDPAEPGRRDAPDVVVGAESPAYILFTSGSTGTPKGVLRPHRLHTTRIFLEQSMYAVGPDDRHLLKLPISSREFLWPLATGGTAVIAEPDGERDDQYLVDLLQRERISVLSCVPSMLRVLAANPGFARCPALRHVFVGGEALHRDLEDQVRAMGYQVHNTFTLTEADYVAHRKDGLDERAEDASVIGHPLDMRVYLCDERGRRVPPGLTGEVWVGGPGVATGYYRDPERTAERFVANPFGDPRTPLLFRTGDLARHRADGSLEYRGRKDLQVKVRGQRVEPTEVEYWLREHPGVRDAAVVGYPDPEQGAFLVAFVVAEERAPAERELRAFLSGRIPAWMLPRHIAWVPRLPQLHSGKLDRASLRLPGRVRPEGLPAPSRARTPDQRRLLAVWRTILQLDDIGVDDAFTALGGDSLRMLLLRAAIQDEFGTRLDLADLFGAPTVLAQERLLPGGPPATTTVTAAAVPRRTGAAAAADERARRRALREAQPNASAERSERR